MLGADLLLFWSLDRLTREGSYKTLTYLRRLTDSGLKFKSYTEQYIDSLGVFGEAIIGVLAATGAKRLALEDPSSNDDALPAARAAGLEVVGIPVDGDGIRVDLLRASGADAVILTPSHQWPTGAVLSAANRAAVIRWAT